MTPLVFFVFTSKIILFLPVISLILLKLKEFKIETALSAFFITSLLSILYLLLITVFKINELPVFTNLFSNYNITPEVLDNFILLFYVIVTFGFSYKLDKTFKNILLNLKFERKYFQLINNYPNLICQNHVAKVTYVSTIGISRVECRFDGDCHHNGNIIFPVKNIIGVLGDDNLLGVDNENFYINIWNAKDKSCINGDYDIIEIRASDKIKDYDFIIQNIYSFLYNDLNRIRPVNEIIVRIVGNPLISENSLNLLKEKFKTVEYN
jgi:hypothetical protein